MKGLIFLYCLQPSVLLVRLLLKPHCAKRPGKYTRLIGFYYEFCTGATLDPSIEVGGNYVPALEESEYVTLAGKNSTRWRVRNNLLGSADFCPMVRQKQGIPSANDTSLQHAVSAMVADL